MARRKETAHGGHGWFVTFADLMGLLVSFFVMLVAFSTQDQAKLQVVAGSMRDAFGVQDRVRYSGIVEVNGLPTRPKLKNAAQIDPIEASATPTPDEHDRQRSQGARIKQEKDFALASASLRQAMQDLPDISEVSKHILMEDTKEGLNIEIVDQDGRSMCADGSKEPNARTRALLEKMAPAFKAMPYRLSIVGHTAATTVPPAPGYGPWDLSADRANAVRGILAAEGVDASHISMVAGKADTEPLFPDNPSLAPNRRVTITMLREAPPLPPDFRP